MAETLHGMLIESAREHADKTAYIHRVAGEWVHMPYSEALERTEAIGAGLLDLGIGSLDRVSILSNTRMEWSIADYAILGTGATTVPIYQTNSASECQFVLADAGAVAVFVEDAGQLDKIREERGNMPDLRHVIVIDPTGASLSKVEGAITLEELEQRGRTFGTDKWHAAGDKIAPGALATIIYTSGTTGPPKGCMLSHHNYVHMVEQGIDEAVGLWGESDRITLFLPLAHTFARLAHFVTTRLGIELTFSTITTLMDDMQEIKPTVLPSVPRVFEKAYTRILGQFNEATGVKRRLIDRAMRVGALRGRYIQHGRRVPPVLAAQYALFHKLIFSKIHDRFGGNIRIFISGGAPLSREVQEFFLACGLIIIEGFGLTESTTAVTVNSPNNFRCGSVGRAFKGTELKIAPDGELLVKGDVVFQGYFGNPKATAEVLQDGWLHTGDVATIDREGFVYITDRKKDIIVTAGGKNVAPQNIEGALKATQYISQALVYGDKKPYLTALLTLDPDEMASFAKTNKLTGEMIDWIATEEVADLIHDSVDKVNSQVGRVEQVKRYRILPIDFAQETGELTPSLKLKRKVVCERYHEWIEQMYEADAEPFAAITDPRIAELQDAVHV